jgi:hypothetical protein
LYTAFKITAKLNGVDFKVAKDTQMLDDQFIHNYASAYLFYHKVIRMQELEDIRPKLPHFPYNLLKYFRMNSFLSKIDLKGDKGDITTFLNPSHKICSLLLPEGFSSHRLVELSEFHDHN